MTTHFVSDTHFGHAPIITCRMQVARPFASIEAHDEVLITNWNATV